MALTETSDRPFAYVESAQAAEAFVVTGAHFAAVLEAAAANMTLAPTGEHYGVLNLTGMAEFDATMLIPTARYAIVSAGGFPAGATSAGGGSLREATGHG